MYIKLVGQVVRKSDILFPVLDNKRCNYRQTKYIIMASNMLNKIIERKKELNSGKDNIGD